MYLWIFFFFKQKTAYEMRISDWSSDVCSSDLDHLVDEFEALAARQRPDLDVHIAELAVPAGLALEARVLLGRLADGLLVGGLRARGVDLRLAELLVGNGCVSTCSIRRSPCP